MTDKDWREKRTLELREYLIQSLSRGSPVLMDIARGFHRWVWSKKYPRMNAVERASPVEDVALSCASTIQAVFRHPSANLNLPFFVGREVKVLVTNAMARPVFADRSFTAVIAANDTYARRLVNLFTRAALAVPDDVSIVSFDNSIEDRFHELPVEPSRQLTALRRRERVPQGMCRRRVKHRMAERLTGKRGVTDWWLSLRSW